MGGLRYIADSLAPAVDLVFPPRCPGCGQGVASQTGLCRDCWDTLSFPPPGACRTCFARRHAATFAQRDWQCAPCLAASLPYDGIYPATLYGEVSRRLVLAYKHGRKIALAKMMGRMMAAAIPPDTDRLLVPVPLHRWRLWQRGFNQSVLLAQELRRLQGGTVLVDGLVRMRPTPSLGSSGRVERAAIMSKAIGVNPRRRLRLQGASVLLIDDVYTSGATTLACANALREAGVAHVAVACFALTPMGSLDTPSGMEIWRDDSVMAEG